MDHRARYAMRQQLHRFTALFVSMIIAAAATALQSLYPNDPVPYHTSVLTGEAWVSELMKGHPKRIHCELGVHLSPPF